MYVYLHYELNTPKRNRIAVKLLRWILPLAIFDKLDPIICDYKPAENLFAGVIIIFFGDHVKSNFFDFAGVCPFEVASGSGDAFVNCFIFDIIFLDPGIGNETIGVNILPLGIWLFE